MSCTLIINPASRNGRSRKHIDGIIAKCSEKLDQVDIRYASGFYELRELSRKANLGNAGQVVAVGGDGTINAVLNGFYDGNGRRISRSRMGVIYTGTSPDFCKSYGIPLDHDRAIECICRGKTKQIIPGMINLVVDPESEARETRYFACCANTGVGAGVARDANRIRRYAGDLAGTFIALIRNIITFKAIDLDVTIDGEYLQIDRVLNISIGRTPYIASSIKVNDEDIIQQDNFYIMMAMNIRLLDLPGLVKQIYTGQIRNTAYLQLRKGQSITLGSVSDAVEVEFDGDPAGYLPCLIRTAGEKIEIITA